MEPKTQNLKQKSSFLQSLFRQLKRLAALSLVLALIFAVPAILAWSPSPLDSERGVVSIIRALLTGGQIFEEALISLVVALGWVTWAYLVICIVAEVVMAIRGLCGYVKGLRFGQSLLRPLLASLWWSSTLTGLAISTVGTGTVMALTQSQAQASMVETASEHHLCLDTVDQITASEQSDAVEVVTGDKGTFTVDGVQASSHLVAESDTLWDIAHKHLGDGFRWREIMSMNPEISDPDLIEIDTLLYLPADAVQINDPTLIPETLTEVQDIEQDVEHSVELGEHLTVQRGDTLWSLAQNLLGSNAANSEIDALINTVDSQDLTSGDPDLIYPGEQIVFNADRLDTFSAHADTGTVADSGQNTGAETTLETDVEIFDQEIFFGDETTSETADTTTSETADTHNAADEQAQDSHGITGEEAGEHDLDSEPTAEGEEVVDTPVSDGPVSNAFEQALESGADTETSHEIELASPTNLVETSPQKHSQADIGLSTTALLNRPALIGGTGAAILAASVITTLQRRRREQRRSYKARTLHDEATPLSAQAIHLGRELEGQAAIVLGESIGWKVTNVNLTPIEDNTIKDSLVSEPTSDSQTEHTEASENVGFKVLEEDAQISSVQLLVGTDLANGDAIELNLAPGDVLSLEGDRRAYEKFCHAATIWLATSQQGRVEKILYLADDETLEVHGLENVENYRNLEELVDAATEARISENTGARQIAVVSAKPLPKELSDRLTDSDAVVICGSESTQDSEITGTATADPHKNSLIFGPYQARLEPLSLEIDFLGYSDFRRMELNELFSSVPQKQANVDTATPLCDDVSTAAAVSYIETECPVVKTDFKADCEMNRQCTEIDPVEQLPSALVTDADGAVILDLTDNATPADDTAIEAEHQWPHICILGPPEVVGAGPLTSSKSIDVVTYLAFNRQGVTADQLSAWIWPPSQCPTPKAVANVLSRTRKALGDDSNGEPLLSRAGTDRIYKLSALVTTDYDFFSAKTKAAAKAREQEQSMLELELLTEAIAYIRGVPFSGGGPYGFSWADQQVRSLVEFKLDEAIHRATELAIELGETEKARTFIDLGLRLLPGCEACFALRFDLAVSNGSQRELDVAMSDLTVTLTKEYSHETATGQGQNFDCDNWMTQELKSHYRRSQRLLEEQNQRTHDLLEVG